MIGSGGNETLQQADPQVYDLLQREQKRQAEGLELIASENFTSLAVLEALGSAFTNKYSEGLPGARYYGGNQVIDQLESLTQSRALTAFSLDSREWGVNVQPYSGSVANLAAFVAVLKPHDRFMGLGLASGGHLSHGHYVGAKKINVSSIVFESLPYHVSPDTGLVDYDAVEQQAQLFRPKMLVAGGSAYPRDWDYARMRCIADSVGALLLVDMAHYSGLVAGGVVKDPFQYADIVTTTTHKSLRGPRAAMIFFKEQFRKDVNFAVFPTIQGGPHNHQIAGICVQMKEVASQAFKDYARQVVLNSKALCDFLLKKGYSLVSGGSDTHLILWDLRKEGVSGGKMEALCDAVAITLNKNSVYGDKKAFAPGGVRVGTPALTTRGFMENDFTKVGEFLHKALELAKELQKNHRMLKDFKASLEGNESVTSLRREVEFFSKGFPMPGKL